MTSVQKSTAAKEASEMEVDVIEVQADGNCKEKDSLESPPRGRSVSGKIWKAPKQRASTVKKSTHGRYNLRKQVLLKEEAKRAQELALALKTERENELTAKREREKAKKQQKEENTKKSEIVQVIKNPSKIKRLKKSQLRSIEKRDTATASSDGKK